MYYIYEGYLISICTLYSRFSSYLIFLVTIKTAIETSYNFFKKLISWNVPLSNKIL